MWYFAHRWRVQNYREKVLADTKIKEKILATDLSEDDKDAVKYVMKSLNSTKAKWNYVVIFVFSAIALIYAIFLDFIL